MTALPQTSQESKNEQRWKDEQHRIKVEAELEDEHRRRVERHKRRTQGDPPPYKDPTEHFSHSDGEKSKTGEGNKV